MFDQFWLCDLLTRGFISFSLGRFNNVFTEHSRSATSG